MIVDRNDESSMVDLWFAFNHNGGLRLNECDLSSTYITFTAQQSVNVFANTIFASIADLMESVTDKHFDKHWNKIFPYAVYCDLKQFLTH